MWGDRVILNRRLERLISVCPIGAVEILCAPAERRRHCEPPQRKVCHAREPPPLPPNVFVPAQAHRDHIEQRGQNAGVSKRERLPNFGIRAPLSLRAKRTTIVRSVRSPRVATSLIPVGAPMVERLSKHRTGLFFAKAGRSPTPGMGIFEAAIGVPALKAVSRLISLKAHKRTTPNTNRAGRSRSPGPAIGRNPRSTLPAINRLR